MAITTKWISHTIWQARRASNARIFVLYFITQVIELVAPTLHDSELHKHTSKVRLHSSSTTVVDNIYPLDKIWMWPLKTGSWEITGNSESRKRETLQPIEQNGLEKKGKEVQSHPPYLSDGISPGYDRHLFFASLEHVQNGVGSWKRSWQICASPVKDDIWNSYLYLFNFYHQNSTTLFDYPWGNKS